MFGGIFWVLAVVAFWATIFVLSLMAGRTMARSHDREALLEAGIEQDLGVISDVTSNETAHQVAKAS